VTDNEHVSFNTLA